MGLKNKSELKDQFTKGKMVCGKYWALVPSPEKFANSSDLRRIKNRNRKNK